MNEDGLNYKKIWNFLTQYKIVFAILLLVFISTFLRMQTYSLPGTFDAAENQIVGNIKGNIQQQVINDFPNLMPKAVSVEVEKRYSEFIKANNIEPYVQQQADSYKNYFQDTNGRTYLLELDPYHYFQLAEWEVNTGHQGIDVNGTIKNPLMRGRTNEVTIFWNLHSGLEAYIYKISHTFNKDTTLMQVAFFMPVWLMALAVMIFFFVGYKIGGLAGGIIAGFVIGTHSSILGRTVAGFSDTDPYYLIFPGLAILCFLYSFNYTGWKKYLLLTLTGMSISIHHTLWGGWWYTLVFILASAMLLVIVDWRTSKDTTLLILLSTIAFSTLFCGLCGYGWTFGITDTLASLYELPMEFINIKAVALNDIWPNVMTTVAELNPSSFDMVSRSANFNLFFLGILGVFFAGLYVYWNRNDKKELTTNLVIVGLLATWIVAGTFAAITSIRFVAILVPGLALGFAYLLPKLYDLCTRQSFIPEIGIKLTGIALILFILLPIGIDGYNTTKQEFPLMNDDWNTALTAIAKEPKPSMIFSWWDSGFHFEVVANSSVVFDGGDQGRRIYWVGKALLTDNPEQSKAIMRMLNCGSDHTPNTLEEYFKNTERAVMITEKIIMQTEEEARHTLYLEALSQEQTDYIISQTFCTTWPQYLILSEDMIGKAGVWAHFGSWNFTKAEMYYNAKNLNYEKGTSYLMGEGMSSTNASKIYYEIQNTPADQWIANWPSYASGWMPNNQTINTTQLNGLTIINDTKNNRMMVSSPELQNSIFTRLYLLDETIPGFEPFINATTQGIKTYKVTI